MAKYGASSLRLADAVRQLDVPGWLAAVHGLSTWPPTWPLVESAVFLLFGGDVSVARSLVVACWILAIPAAAWALRPLPGGDAAGLLAACWLAQSPLLQALATVHLLEVPGILLLLVCVGCGVRALDPAAERRRRERWWRATWCASLLLFFLKYNYGLLWLAPLLVTEGLRRAGGWRPLAGWALRRARAVRWTPWSVFVAVTALLLVVLRGTGGVDTEILGLRVRATSVGNPAYALLLLACLRLGLRAVRGGRAARLELRRRWRRFDASWHGLGSWLVAPVTVWMLLPPHLKEFFGFVENRDSGLGWTESLAFYPRVLLEQASATPALAVAALVPALAGLLWLRSPDGRRRLLALATATAWLALLAHPYKLPRFSVQAAVLTGVLASAWASGAVRRSPRLRRLATSAAALAAVGVLWVGVDLPFVEAQHRLRTVPSDAAETVEAAARVAAQGGILLGTWNEFSPGLVEWQARRDYALDAGWRPVTTLDLTRRRDPRAVLRALAETPCRPVGFVTSERPGWLSETAWLGGVIPELQSDPCRWPEVRMPGLTVYACRQGGDADSCRRR